jgi:phosphoserine/homoserine phosphotransferase
MYLVCLDLESILVPEIWMKIAEATKIKGLKLTTRDVRDYDVLMKRRLKILRTHNIKLKDIQKIILKMEPLKGALAFLNWLRKRSQVIVLSDTFIEFGSILMQKLGYPTLFCHSLEVDKNGFIKNYRLRENGGKVQVVKALQRLGFKVIAIGDSYNDITMLKEADVGFLFKASDKVRKEFSQFSNAQGYKELKSLLEKYI